MKKLFVILAMAIFLMSGSLVNAEFPAVPVTESEPATEPESEPEEIVVDVEVEPIEVPVEVEIELDYGCFIGTISKR